MGQAMPSIKGTNFVG